MATVRGGGKLAGEQLVGGLIETSLILLRRREAEREPGVGAFEAAMHEEMARLDGRSVLALRREPERVRRLRRRVAPFLDIDIGLIEGRIFRIPRHEHGLVPGHGAPLGHRGRRQPRKGGAASHGQKKTAAMHY